MRQLSHAVVACHWIMFGCSWVQVHSERHSNIAQLTSHCCTTSWHAHSTVSAPCALHYARSEGPLSVVLRSSSLCKIPGPRFTLHGTQVGDCVACCNCGCSKGVHTTSMCWKQRLLRFSLSSCYPRPYCGSLLDLWPPFACLPTANQDGHIWWCCQLPPYPPNLPWVLHPSTASMLATSVQHKACACWLSCSRTSGRVDFPQLLLA
jgi:hypothetical protein